MVKKRVPLDQWLEAILSYAPEIAEEAFDDVAERIDPRSPRREYHDITERRGKVRELLKLGLTNDQIAHEVACSVATVKRDLQAMGLRRRKQKR